MMSAQIEREAGIIADGFGAAGGHRMLAVGPYAGEQAAACIRTGALRVACGVRSGTVLPEGVVLAPYGVDEVWQYSAHPPRGLFELVAVDRVYPDAQLFSILASVVPLLVVGGIVILHAYSDFLDDDPYRCQNRALVVVMTFLRVYPNFFRRNLAGQAVELGKRSET